MWGGFGHDAFHAVGVGGVDFVGVGVVGVEFLGGDFACGEAAAEGSWVWGGWRGWGGGGGGGAGGVFDVEDADFGVAGGGDESAV